MTNTQRLAVRLSEIRQRLNEIAGLAADEMTDEVRAESDRLVGEYRTAETQHRAELIAEADGARAAAGEFGNGDAEAAEVRALLARVTIGDYLNPAAAGSGLAGAAVELAGALECPTAGASGGVAVPWAVLGRGIERRAAPEARAFTTTGQNDGPESQRPILQRLFGPGIMDALGVRLDTVPAGRTEWPLVASGVTPAQVVEGTAAGAAVAMTVNYANLKPKRLTGRYEFTHEAAATVADLEQAIRRDLADAIMSAMSNAIINGAAVDANDAATAANVEGFLSKLSAPTAPSAEAAYADYAGSHAALVDGLHASREGEVSSVIGVASYAHAASVYQAGSGESGSEALMRRSMSCMASSYIPAASGTPLVQDGNVYHAMGPNGGGIMRGDSVAAMWPTLEVIRDIYSQASQGVTLTWVTLWDAAVAFRSSAYARVAFQLA